MSTKSNDYERLIAQNINKIASSEGIVGLKAAQSKGGPQFSDVVVTYQATRSPL